MRGTEMIAICTDKFAGVPDGEVYPHVFKEGDHIRGDLAAVAVTIGKAKWKSPRIETKEIAPKKKTGGPTGRGKPSLSQPAGQAKTKRTYKRRGASAKS